MWAQTTEQERNHEKKSIEQSLVHISQSRNIVFFLSLKNRCHLSNSTLCLWICDAHCFWTLCVRKRKTPILFVQWAFFLTQTISICELKVVSQRENLNIAQIMMCPLSATCDTFRCFDWFGYIARIIAYQQQISKWANNWNQSGSKKIHAKMPHKYAIHIQWICIAKCALCSRVSQAKPSTTKPSQSQFEREFQVIIEKQSECCTHRHKAKSICMGKMVCNYQRHISSWNNVSIE